jgi:deoxyribodipyrimidine photo-lyase
MNRVDPARTRILKVVTDRVGPVVYWMNRDQRVNDNWALLCAQQIAADLKMPLFVLHIVPEERPPLPLRQYGFMLRGLQRVESGLKKLNIPFSVYSGSHLNIMELLVNRHKIGHLVTDYSPLRLHRETIAKIAKQLPVNIVEVDAHNIVPCWAVSDKQEYSAGTIRPKIHRLLDQYLTDFPKLKPHSFEWPHDIQSLNWTELWDNPAIDRSVPEIDWLAPGETEALKTLDAFLEHRLEHYPIDRNNPVKHAQSNLSPYLHFGQLSAQRVALETMRHPGGNAAKETFLEELIVRRELADNFCCFNPHYDTVEGFHPWALKSLKEHLFDKRDYIYTIDEFEAGLTHDPLWNAAQRKMARTGKMHGYMRMYWAKKILEWSATPSDAMAAAIYLNDKYELDGRDPNGYTGVAWSIGGVHDRAWFNRPVYGKIRYMNANGCRSKFDVDKYIEHNRSKKEHESVFAG